MRDREAGPGLARLVEREMGKWELARSQREAGEARPEVQEFVTVSRGVGTRLRPTFGLRVERTAPKSC